MVSLSQVEVIVNAGSGADDKEAICRRITELFDAYGLRANVALAASGAEMLEIARHAVRGHSQVIVAGGGDGTISAVAALLTGSSKTLGVLPLGTLNHFAKDLGIPLDLDAAVRTIAQGQAIEVDVGLVNDRVFINNSSLGLYPEFVHYREIRQRRGLGKWLAFVWAALVVLRRYPLLNVRLNIDDQEFIHRTPLVFVGNNEYKMNLMEIGTRSCLTEGQLSIYLAPLKRRFSLLRLMLRAFFGRLEDDQDFIALCAQEIWVETRRERRLLVATDGEVNQMATPLHYVIRPGALRVLIPAGSGQWSVVGGR